LFPGTFLCNIDHSYTQESGYVSSLWSLSTTLIREGETMRKGTLLLGPAVAVFLLVAQSAPVQGQRGGQVELAEGDGKAMVSTVCSACHGLNLITNSAGYSQEEWVHVFGAMVTLPTDQRDVVAGYLAANYSEKPDAAKAVLIDGSVDVNIREWLAPTLGQRPHDPLAARDGSIWWTGQHQSRLGRVDPSSGATKEFVLDTPDSGPHGLVEDADGNIWYTGINVQEIGMLNPSTGAVTEYKITEPGSRGPHTPIFDDNGTLFFTMQSGHVGRLVPSTGEITVAKTPTDGTYPYGIQVNSEGVPWYVDYRGNRVGSVDPVTMEITEHTLPNPDSRPRRIALTPDDAVWYTDFPRGYLGRFDPKTGETQEWASPGGARSRPYGIATVGNVIWYSESGVKPNTLVRFDSATNDFQTWAIPSGGGVVRNMMATADGDLVLACSARNRVALVEVGGSAGTR
jgi:virginiamycin B lyase